MTTLSESFAPRQLIAPQAITATQTTPAIDRNQVGRAQEYVFLLAVGAVAGTTPTMDIAIQTAENDVAAEYVTVQNFPQVTAATFQEMKVTRTGRFVRAVVTVAGTGPSFTMSLTALAGQPLEGPI